MPQLGETVTEGTITRWFKQVGETVAADEPLFEVSTDKVDSEVPAPAAGVVSEILVAEGDTVDVGARLAVISDAAQTAPPAAPARAGSTGARRRPNRSRRRLRPSPLPPRSPRLRRRSRPRPGHASEVAPGSRECAGPDRRAAAAVTSPLVRRMIAEHGLDAGADQRDR